MTNPRQRLCDISPALEQEFMELHYKIENGSIKASKVTVKGYRNGLLQGIKAWPEVSADHLAHLQNHGVKSLRDQKYWLHLEIAAFSNLEKQKAVAFTRSLDFLYRLTHPENYTGKPTFVTVHGSLVGLLDIYLKSELLGDSVRSAITKFVDSEALSKATKVAVVQQVVSIIKALASDENSDVMVLLESVLDEGHLIEAGIKKHRVMPVRSQLRAFIEVVYPDLFYRQKLLIGGRSLDVTELHATSKTALMQIKALAGNAYYSGEFGHVSGGLKGRLSCSIRTILRFVQKDHNFKIKFAEIGLDALSSEGNRPLKDIFRYYKQHEATAVANLYEHYSGIKVNQRILFQDILFFENDKSGKVRTLDISFISEICLKLREDIVSIHQEETELLSQKNYGAETLHARFSKIIKVFSAYCDRDTVNGLGVSFLSANDGKIQLEVLSKIQADVLAKSVSRRTAEGYISAIRWLCGITRQKYINAYRITSNRHAVHALRMKSSDTYTLDEIRELAFHIEKGVVKHDWPLQDRLAMYFARIQIKTCWNTSVIANIECSDIRQIDIPTSTRPVTIFIQKPRKGYKTDHFNFDYKSSRSAIHDLLKVRDTLTSSTRSKYGGHDNSRFLFIYEELGQLKTIDYNVVVARIATILMGLGCTVKYNSVKLRKTGSNEVYRQLSKDFKRYKDTFKHSYPTFIKNYQRVSEASSKTTLSDATKIMEQYFVGKELSSNIEIVTEYESGTQLTPVGGCNAEKGSKEAHYYAKQNRLLASNKIDRCGDFMACIWCKHYRVVADADHVWQLLSFKDYVLGDMQGAIAHFSDVSLQKQAHRALSERVDVIISRLKITNSDQVSLGRTLFKNNGLHPIWNFAISDIAGVI
ncbi:hypothetical protein EAY31_15900 [Vibrio anguillarum]|nr:hypothetical protein [Vibrio anguillarum]MBF4257146.1 hypothetical protein [Vibrio anguillarum]MBF4298993.1 hypothetical protein [Vibrio anguillarum]MBF4399254.1 hypothetical protein [Vibrio anguillarum]MBF4440653.1 hypothetical protein [Vibrio anguillarum]